jgi:hypothetical protein
LQNLQSLLWVGKQPKRIERATDGDEIYDKEVTNILESQFAINRLYIAPQSKTDQVVGLLAGLPHPRYKYYSRSILKEFAAKASSADHIVISWEAIEYLALTPIRPITLIVHNVMSDTLNEIMHANFAAKLAALQSKYWEGRLYAKENLHIVVLSNRDKSLIQSLAPSARVTVAAPGCPTPLSMNQDRIIREIVISGSYGWRPKRRDLLLVADEFSRSDLELVFRHDKPLPKPKGSSLFHEHSISIDKTEYSQGLRIGLIPDTFLSGFKLKSTYYIAMNCVIASRCDIRGEFTGLPYAEEFVRVVRSLDDLNALYLELSLADSGLFDRWNSFKQACLAHFSWEHTAEAIRSTIS